MVRYWEKIVSFCQCKKKFVHLGEKKGFSLEQKKRLVRGENSQGVLTSLLILINLQSVIETFTFNHSRVWLCWSLSTTDHLSGWLPLSWWHHPVVHSRKSGFNQWLWNQKWQITYWLMNIWDYVTQNTGNPMFEYLRRYCAATCMLFGTVSRLGQYRKTSMRSSIFGVNSGWTLCVTPGRLV